jgi:hypothetical protein
MQQYKTEIGSHSVDRFTIYVGVATPSPAHQQLLIGEDNTIFSM